MKMIGELFRELSFTVEEKGNTGENLHCIATLVPDPESVILKAHFPERPVVPGACLLATVSELVCRMLHRSVYVNNVKTIKFVSLIEPDGEEPVSFNVSLDVAAMKVKATISYKQAICCKMSLSCTTAF